MQLYWKRWQDVPAEVWVWEFFTPEEIACNGTGSVLINPAALDALDALRREMGMPLVLNSAYRSPAWNAQVGGAANSKHMMGIAFDIRNDRDFTRDELVKAARGVGFLGFGNYRSFLHVDLGPARMWAG